jgi:hypothetical protein
LMVKARMAPTSQAQRASFIRMLDKSHKMQMPSIKRDATNAARDYISPTGNDH